ncbi:O-acyltransferase like protein-like [Aricia agestis]|uniref:O-acyltransferase like protein-like n=1 Tax=Aricia agestis TaxID=91739 RepID=UPI001C204406|nr:O-acyltransferase like protein-like [Aricia agestis]
MEGRPRTAFDYELYESVLDSSQCQMEMRVLASNPVVFARFLDAGLRIPRDIFSGSTTDYGNYWNCLAINELVEETPIEGKYCFVRIPVEQELYLPFNLSSSDVVRYTPSSFDSFVSGPQSFAVNRGAARSGSNSPIASLEYRFGVCIPKPCTTHDWISNILFNVSIFGFEFQEEFCRLPNDKPFVAADYVAITIFSFIGLITILSTGYDLHHTHILKRDPRQANIFLRMFSVYTNSRRLLTFSKNPNALDCMDGIRTISMMWVVIGHTYSAFNFQQNLIESLRWLTSAKAIWISTGLFTVDSFFMMAGLLLVYTSIGKMTGMILLRKLPSFYINRLLRMFPLLAALVLLEASVFHRVGDGPYWMTVASNTDKCRTFWWSTLLHIQNYLNPNDNCIQHSWYIAIDIQLHIISPLVLFWVLDKDNKRSAWTALTIGILVVLAGSTVVNFLLNMPSTNMTLSRLDEQASYMSNFYMNTLTRASPFFIGMFYGYILALWKGKEVRINKFVVALGWLLALTLIGLCFYMSFVIMELTWDNQIGDNLFNSYMRAAWAMGVGWIILACVKGYGGPINWFLSLDMWKLPARISFAMYLCHYPIQFVVTGMELTPTYFRVDAKFFEFLAVITLTFIVAYVMTVTIDAPFSVLTKILMGGGVPKRPRPKPQAEVIENGKEEHINGGTPINGVGVTANTVLPKRPKSKPQAEVIENGKEEHINGGTPINGVGGESAKTKF